MNPNRERMSLAPWMFHSRSARWIPANEAQAAAVRQLTVVTYNIWFGEYRCGERLAHLLTLVADCGPDIIAFQEVTPRQLAPTVESRGIFTCLAPSPSHRQRRRSIPPTTSTWSLATAARRAVPAASAPKRRTAAAGPFVPIPGRGRTVRTVGSTWRSPWPSAPVPRGRRPKSGGPTPAPAAPRWRATALTWSGRLDGMPDCRVGRSASGGEVITFDR
jgi:hypothetical protein